MKSAALDPRLPRYQRLRDSLESRIAAGRWKLGQSIPTEAELGAEHGLSIGTVRKAVDALVAQGLLERIQGKGTYIRRPRFDSSLFRFFRFEGRDGHALSPVGKILKRELAAAPGPVAAALGLVAGARAVHLNRLRLVEGRPFLVESIWLPRDRFAALLKIDPAAFGDLLYPLYESHCGQVVASAEETLAAEAVSARHGKLLGLEPGTPVIVIERLARSFDRRPLEWRRTLGAADKFRYHVEFR